MIQIRYYSRTGTTHQVATDIADRIPDSSIERIYPVKERSYPNWLARSFLPGSTVDIEPTETDLTDANVLFLGMPKWTFSCPPAMRFLKQATLDDVPVGLFITYGGFDEKRYATSHVSRLQNRGADVRGVFLVQRDKIDTTEYNEGLEQFCRSVIPE